MQRLSALRGRGPLAALAAAAVLSGLVSLAAVPPPATGVQAAGSYSKGATDCSDTPGIDPVGLIFRGSDAGWQNTAVNFIEHGPWPFRGTGLLGGGSQYLTVYRQEATSVCRTRAENIVSNPFGESDFDRYHARLWLTWLVDKPKWTAATPHWERFDQTCGHFVVDHNYTLDQAGVRSGGFNFARKEARAGFINGGHPAESFYWGNTAQMDQCEDHGPVGSDGWVVFITIDHSH